MSEIKFIPIVEVNSSNYLDILPCLTVAIKTSTFISIDSELSGLGDRKKLMQRDIDERYKYIGEVAKSYSIISLGISCFRLNEKSSCEDKLFGYTVQTFDLLLFCLNDYTVESSAIKFLLEHGFDFNAQYKYGLPYYRGNEEQTDIESLNESTIRQLFCVIIKAKKPFIVHNGLVDLIFLYENLYANLPQKLSTFLTDLSQLFSNAIYDTKYFADFEMRSEASYLEYIFRKCQRQNCIRSKQNKNFCKISFLNYDAKQPVVLLPCSLTSQPCVHDIGKTIVCQNFANHGWCTNGNNCSDSHDIDLILDMQENSRNKISKPRDKSLNSSSTTNDSTDEFKNFEVLNPCLHVSNLSNSAGINANSNSNSCSSPTDHDTRTIEFTFETQNGMDHDGNKTNKNKICIEESNKSSNIFLDSSEIILLNDDLSTFDKKDLVLSNSNFPVEKQKEIMQNGDHQNSILKSSHIDNRTSGHRAGLDAFMTGYIFATSLIKKKAVKNGEISEEFKEEFGNKVYLCGKSFPLQVVQSSYSKPSKNHFEKYNKLIAN